MDINTNAKKIIVEKGSVGKTLLIKGSRMVKIKITGEGDSGKGRKKRKSKVSVWKRRKSGFTR